MIWKEPSPQPLSQWERGYKIQASPSLFGRWRLGAKGFILNNKRR